MGSKFANAPQSGLGATIIGIDGAKWGVVVGEEPGCWRLRTGRIAKKDTEGYRWYWSIEGGMSGESLEIAPEKNDLIFVKGLGDQTRTGISVMNNEYIVFHPHQCLPLYEIEHELERQSNLSFFGLTVLWLCTVCSVSHFIFFHVQ